ncbi:hypothetical protein KFK09_008069 [Dendrobium nobile]|uniref:Uncharacterized protein n=1 Tax=Dendrobium nobile TaxID=94219 RepID=A0A8T3BYN2_DENNO|nr:hypothetical protein KFK09_008069 [Dendrobium nobile]
MPYLEENLVDALSHIFQNASSPNNTLHPTISKDIHSRLSILRKLHQMQLIKESRS